MNLILLQRQEVSKDGKTAILSAHDHRTKHIRDHLCKLQGDEVWVGVLGERPPPQKQQHGQPQSTTTTTTTTTRPGDDDTTKTRGGAKGKAVVEYIHNNNNNNNNDDDTTPEVGSLRLVFQFNLQGGNNDQHHDLSSSPDPIMAASAAISSSSSSSSSLNNNQNNHYFNTSYTVTLILAVPFPQRLKYLWPVIASMAAPDGKINRVILVRGQLSGVDHCNTSALRPDVYEPLLLSGMSQGGGGSGGGGGGATTTTTTTTATTNACLIPLEVVIEIDTVVTHSTLKKLHLLEVKERDDTDCTTNDTDCTTTNDNALLQPMDPAGHKKEKDDDDDDDDETAGQPLRESKKRRRTTATTTGHEDCHPNSNHYNNTKSNNNNSSSSSTTTTTLKLFLDCGDETTVPPSALDLIFQTFLPSSSSLSTSGTPSLPTLASTPTVRPPPPPPNSEIREQALHVIVAVGPERGWTDEEARLFCNEAGFQAATIGTSILRVDTAVSAGLGIVCAAMDHVIAMSRRRRHQWLPSQQKPHGLDAGLE
jgi:hypothetical protein